MRLAIEQGELVKGHSYPNPPVGAVILDRDGEAVGVGATEPTGGRRGGRAGPRRRVGGRRHRRRHARAVATTWARPRPAWMPVWTGFRRSFTRWPIPIRSRPGGAIHLAAAGVANLFGPPDSFRSYGIRASRLTDRAM
jgi:hypothetical protein